MKFWNKVCQTTYTLCFKIKIGFLMAKQWLSAHVIMPILGFIDTCLFVGNHPSQKEVQQRIEELEEADIKEEKLERFFAAVAKFEVLFLMSIGIHDTLLSDPNPELIESNGEVLEELEDSKSRLIALIEWGILGGATIPEQFRTFVKLAHPEMFDVGEEIDDEAMEAYFTRLHELTAKVKY